MKEIKAEINLLKMANDVACIKQALLGNGQPGLCKRVEELENAERKRSITVGFCTGIGAVLGAAATQAINIFKNG